MNKFCVIVIIVPSLKAKNASNVIVTGHSLGAAVAVMDSIFLRNNIDKSIPIRTTVFGLPRSGNQAWAYVYLPSALQIECIPSVITDTILCCSDYVDKKV